MPPGDVPRRTVSDALDEYRSTIRRLSPHETLAAQRSGAVVIDTRDAADRAAEGVIPGALPIALSVLLWRADPSSPSRDERISRLDADLVIVCNDGYSSSWAAATLKELGFRDVADLVGGHRAWVAEGLPVVDGH